MPAQLHIANGAKRDWLATAEPPREGIWSAWQGVFRQICKCQDDLQEISTLIQKWIDSGQDFHGGKIVKGVPKDGHLVVWALQYGDIRIPLSVNRRMKVCVHSWNGGTGAPLTDVKV